MKIIRPGSYTMLKKTAFSIAGACLTVGLLILAGEALFRFSGYSPETYLPLKPGEPVIHEPDPELGWIGQAGNHVWVVGTNPEKRLPHTYWESGLRATAPRRVDRDERVLVVGCSLTQGYSIADQDTYTWKLQERFPNVQWLNYSSGGYGTYQNLLMLERLLPLQPKPPIVVIYGFVVWHAPRNAADPDYMKGLRHFKGRRHIEIPYGTLDELGNLVRHPPESYPAWPLREHLALVTGLERMYMKVRYGAERFRIDYQIAVTKAVIKEMAHLCERSGTKLFVATLGVDEGDEQRMLNFEQFFRSENIPFCVCRSTKEQEKSWRSPWDGPGGHPDGRMNSLWADCIALALFKEMPDRQARILGSSAKE